MGNQIYFKIAGWVCRSWHAEHVCCLNLTSIAISYSFWNKGQKVLKFWRFDEKRATTPNWILRLTSRIMLTSMSGHWISLFIN